MAEITIQSIIDRLEKAQKPARSLDGSIAETVGWLKRVSMQLDPETNQKQRVVSWRPPVGVDLNEPPLYTSDLQAAYDLLMQIDPSNVGAVTFDGRSQIDGGPVVMGATPQISLCISALIRLKVVTGRS